MNAILTRDSIVDEAETIVAGCQQPRHVRIGRRAGPHLPGVLHDRAEPIAALGDCGTGDCSVMLSSVTLAIAGADKKT